MARKARKRMGRPKKPAGEVKGERLEMALSAGDREVLEAGAHLAGQPLTIFVRESAIACAMRLLKRDALRG